MKKVKIILTALTIVAAVGGALAFKANKFNGDRFCSTVSGGSCQGPAKYKVAIVSGTDLYCTTTAGTCPTTTTKVVRDDQ